MSNRVLVTSLDKRFQKFEKKIKLACQKILKILGKDNVLVEIYLINSQKMRFLNKKFRGKNKTTTVLSFEEPRNFILPASKYKKIGEIYLNLARITRGSYTAEHARIRERSANYKKISEGSAYYLIHGLLHLLGYNHQKKSDRIKMEKKEKEILLTIDH